VGGYFPGRSIRVKVGITPGGASGARARAQCRLADRLTCSRRRARPRASAKHSSGPTYEAPITLRSAWTLGHNKVMRFRARNPELCTCRATGLSFRIARARSSRRAHLRNPIEASIRLCQSTFQIVRRPRPNGAEGVPESRFRKTVVGFADIRNPDKKHDVAGSVVAARRQVETLSAEGRRPPLQANRTSSVSTGARVYARFRVVADQCGPSDLRH
jgi:hypothetical protein